MQAQAVKNHINSLMNLSLKLWSMFSGLDPTNTTSFKLLSLNVLAVNLVYIICGANLSALSQTETFLKEVEVIRTQLS